MMLMRRLLFLAILSSGIATCSFSQVTRGLPPFGSLTTGSDGIETLNLANLNLHLTIPIVNKSGRGFPFVYNLGYDSSIWTPGGSTWLPAQNFGLRTGLPAWNGVLTYSYSSGCQTYPYVGTICWSSGSNYVYTDAAGTAHPFTYWFSCSSGCSYGGSAVASDASGYVIGGNGVMDRSGNNISAPGTGTASVYDTNGNYVSATTSGSTTSVTDTLGRTALTISGSGTPSSPLSITYSAPSGANATYTVKFVSKTVKTNFGCSGISEYGPTANNLVSEIDLPTGTKYLFTYEPTPGYTGDVTGRLASVTLPTGGLISYGYTGANNGITCADGSASGQNVATPDGTTTYSRSGSTTTVTYPQMPYDSAPNQTVYTFNSSGQETQHKVFQGSTSGTLLRTVNTSWATNGTPAAITSVLEDNATQSEIETTYDSYGNLQVIKEHDLGSGAPGPVLRTTNYTYLTNSAYTSLNIMDRVTEKTVSDSSGTLQYREDSAYDGTTISPCPTGVAHHDDSGHGCSFTARGNPTSHTTYTNAAAPSGAVTANSYYDVFGNEVQADSDEWQSIKRTYSATTQYSSPDSLTRGASGGPQLTTGYTYNTYTDQLESVTDPNNKVSSYTHDAMLRPLSLTRPDTTQVTISYNDAANTVTRVDPIDSSHSRVSLETFDGLGRSSTTAIKDASSNIYSISQIQYDPVGRAFKTSNPYAVSPQYWSTVQLDAVGRTTKTVLQDNSQTTYAYALATVTSTDPAGHQRKAQWDGLGRATAIIEPDPTNGNSLTLQTTFAYNVFDSPATVTQGPQVRTFNYDGMARLTSESHPESGTTSYQYNSFSKLTQRTDNRGVIASYSYDTLNRPTQVSYNVGTTGVPATPTVTYSYGTNQSQLNNGRLLTVTDGSGSNTYSYDAMARLTQEVQTIGGSQYTIGYGYNLAGQTTSVTYPSGRVVQQTPDAVGRLASTASGGTTFVSNASYDAGFVLTGLNYGNGVGVAISLSPDRRQIQSLSYSKSGGALFSQTFSYGGSGSNDGHVVGITDLVDSGRSMTYAYDALERLTSATSQGSATYPQWGLSWTYDRYGNRTAQNVTAGTAPSNSLSISGATNQIINSGYAYDANGNMTSDGQNTLIYDAENRVTSSSGGGGAGTYGYEASGLRVQKTTGGTTTVYIFSEGHPIAEYVNGSLSTEYIYSQAGLVAELDGGTLVYHGRDQLSARVHMDSSGNSLGQQGHFPFGEDWYLNNTTTKQHFTTYERDSESGNDYAKSRLDVNRLGRFLTADSARPNASSPQLLNRYTYVRNSPVTMIDPTGHDGLDYYDCLQWLGNDCEGGYGFGCIWGFCAYYPYPYPGSGGGGDCVPNQDHQCPSEPPPPPPPPTPECYANLRYRPSALPKWLREDGTHSFWEVKDLAQHPLVIAGVRESRKGKAYLDVHVDNPNHPSNPQDVLTAPAWFTSPKSLDVCFNVENMLATAYVYPNYKVPYPFINAAIGPNSNSVARYIGDSGFWVILVPPPGAVGWFTLIPGVE